MHTVLFWRHAVICCMQDNCKLVNVWLLNRKKGMWIALHFVFQVRNLTVNKKIKHFSSWDITDKLDNLYSIFNRHISIRIQGIHLDKCHQIAMVCNLWWVPIDPYSFCSYCASATLSGHSAGVKYTTLENVWLLDYHLSFWSASLLLSDHAELD